MQECADGESDRGQCATNYYSIPAAHGQLVGDGRVVEGRESSTCVKQAFNGGAMGTRMYGWGSG